MRVDVGDVRTWSQLAHQVLDPVRRVRPALAVEHSADGVLGDVGWIASSASAFSSSRRCLLPLPTTPIRPERA